MDAAIQLTPIQFAEKYLSKQGQVKGGTLCFWGHWFGKPYDNIHEITAVDYDTGTNILTIRFSEQETLTITNPLGIEEYNNRLQIQNSLPIVKYPALIFKNHPQISTWKNSFGLI